MTLPGKVTLSASFATRLLYGLLGYIGIMRQRVVSYWE